MTSIAQAAKSSDLFPNDAVNGQKKGQIYSGVKQKTKIVLELLKEEQTLN